MIARVFRSSGTCPTTLLHTRSVPRIAALTFALALPVGAFLAVGPAQMAGAQTVEVTNCADSGPGSLRNAVATATSGESIGFALSPACSLITETSGSITVSTNLTLDGPGASALTVSGEKTGSVFVVDNVTATISGLTIEDGDACDGGGIANSGTLTVTDSTLSGNAAGGCGGGGIYNNAGTVTLTGSTVSGNAGSHGAGIYNNAGTVTLTGSTVSDNPGFGGFGGGIYNNAGTVTLTGSTVSGNTAEGGGIYNNAGTVTLTGSTVSDNAGFGGGGGIYNNDSGTVTLTGSTVSGNSVADAFGAGILNGGTLNVIGSTLSGNFALGDSGGGAIFNSGTTNVTDSTLSGNSAGAGGGIDNASTLTLTHATLSGNTADAGLGGGLRMEDGSTTLVATIVANSGAGLDCYVEGTLADGGYNLADDGSCPLGGSSLSDTPAGLDPAGLQDNGGPTPTIALEPGSAAIGYVTWPADCIGNDQRGVPRPTPCDIGAGETPMLSASPSTVAPGGKVVLTFSGFPPDASVVLHVGSATGTVLGIFKMNSNGGLTTGQEMVKSTYKPGTYELYAVGGGDTAEATVVLT